MVEKKQGKPVEEAVEDKVIGNYRSLIQEKRENSSQRRVVAALYSACTFLAVVVLAIGVTMMNNYDKMKNMEEALNSLTQNISGNADKTEQQQTVAANVTVEKVEGNVSPTQPEETQQELPTQPQDQMPTEQTVGNQPETQTEKPTEEPTQAEEPTAAVMGPKAGVYHTVQEGETLTAISMAVYHTDSMVEVIKEANGIEDENKIYPGQEIYLP